MSSGRNRVGASDAGAAARALAAFGTGRRPAVRACAAVGLLAGLAATMATTAADASVRKEGAWPASERAVSLDLRGVPRGEAVKRLADAAGWSLVFASPPGDPVDVALKQQPADKVLDVLLSDGSYVAQRDGTLVSIRLDATPSATAAPTAAPPAAPPPATSAAPSASPPSDAGRGQERHEETTTGVTRGPDRVVTGGSLRIEKDETVHDVAVFGGSVEIWGKVTGDVAVMGGAAKIHEGAHVHGDATAVGGAITIEDGARVDGETHVIGGAVRRGDRAVVGASLEKGHKERHDDDEDEHAPLWRRGISRIGSGITRTALLFVFGSMLLALAAPRMEQLQVEIAGRPMRTFALGVLGVLGSLVLFVALCVTLIGIPIALVAAIGAALAMVAGMSAVVQTIGRAVVGHRSTSVYAHLAAGCVLLLVAGLVPYVGPLAITAIALVGYGSVVATRGTGLFAPKRPVAT